MCHDILQTKIPPSVFGNPPLYGVVPVSNPPLEKNFSPVKKICPPPCEKSSRATPVYGGSSSTVVPK